MLLLIDSFNKLHQTYFGRADEAILHAIFYASSPARPGGDYPLLLPLFVTPLFDKITSIICSAYNWMCSRLRDVCLTYSETSGETAPSLMYLYVTNCENTK